MPRHLNWRWELEIQRNPRELEVPYEVHFFLGPIPPSISDWRVSPSRLFGPTQSFATTLTTEFRPINTYLERRYGGEMKDSDVIPCLRKHLSWRVKKVSAIAR